jgi:hypothetical protein
MSVCASVVPSRFRKIEEPPQHGEKPFAQLVDEAFDGAALSLSNRLRLLEEANSRKIRRGDALDVIASIQRRREKALKVTPRNPLNLFATRYAAFVAAFVALASAWCAVIALQ